MNDNLKWAIVTNCNQLFQIKALFENKSDAEKVLPLFKEIYSDKVEVMFKETAEEAVFNSQEIIIQTKVLYDHFHDGDMVYIYNNKTYETIGELAIGIGNPSLSLDEYSYSERAWENIRFQIGDKLYTLSEMLE